MSHSFENTYVTGDGEKIANVHNETGDCRRFGCAIHAPSGHTLRDWPTRWNDTARAIERVCEHGVAHPDPDHLGFLERSTGDARAVFAEHACDGCCQAGLPVSEDGPIYSAAEPTL